MAALGRVLRGLVVGLAVLAIAGASLAAEVVDLAGPLGVVDALLEVEVLLAIATLGFLLALASFLLARHREDPDAPVESGPSVDALVPVYRDSEVLHRSVEGLVESNYDDLTVTIVCEPDDEQSRDRADELADRHEPVRVLVNEARAGSKAGALNAGIERTEADVVGMFDADQSPHPDFVGHAVAHLDESEVARGRSVPAGTRGVVESEAYYEYLLLFFLPQLLTRALLGLRFVGTRGVLLRRSVFERVGTFDEETLTEDMDFTHRCHQAGVSIRELTRYPCLEEPAHSVSDWWWQRVRWMRGHAEVSHRQLGEWRSLLSVDGTGTLVTLVGTFVAGVLLATLLPKLVLGAIGSPLLVGAGLGGLFATVLLVRLVDVQTSSVSGIGLGWLVLPVFLTMYGLVIVQVLFGYVLGREEGWHRAEKGV